jgi:hypothetical protein
MSKSSRSPQSARGTAQDYEQFSKGDVNTTQHDSPEPENAYARELADGNPGPDESTAGADKILNG